MLWSAFKIAFSMYSKIPMPKTDWTGKNMKYIMCFFPLVGAVVGLLLCGWYHISVLLGFGTIFLAAGLVLIPILVTGGIHMDGFLDTMDAMSSYQTMERRLEILKDSNSGAFAVIGGCIYFLALFGVYSELSPHGVILAAMGFILSRSLSGFGVVKFKCARNSGLVHAFSDGASKQRVGAVMGVYILLISIAMCAYDWRLGSITVITALLTFAASKHMAYKHFGGNTGDLAGHFLQMCELMMAAVLVVAERLIILFVK